MSTGYISSDSTPFVASSIAGRRQFSPRAFHNDTTRIPTLSGSANPKDGVDTMTTSPSSCLAGHSQPRILEHLLLPSSRGLGPIPEETASSFSSSSSHLSPSTEPATEDRRDDDLDKKDPTHGPSTNDPDIPERQTPIVSEAQSPLSSFSPRPPGVQTPKQQEEKGLVELSCATAPANDENNDAIHGPLEPYHVFSRREKWCAVWIVSLAGLFSPLSSNIYFPALGDISLVCFFFGACFPRA